MEWKVIIQYGEAMIQDRSYMFTPSDILNEMIGKYNLNEDEIKSFNCYQINPNQNR